LPSSIHLFRSSSSLFFSIASLLFPYNSYLDRNLIQTSRWNWCLTYLTASHLLPNSVCELWLFCFPSKTLILSWDHLQVTPRFCKLLWRSTCTNDRPFVSEWSISCPTKDDGKVFLQVMETQIETVDCKNCQEN
jgi:hypothetical protein